MNQNAKNVMNSETGLPIYSIKRSVEYITSSSSKCLLFFMIMGFVVYCFLMATVHNRPSDGIQQLNYLQQWHEQGFFNLGGLRISKDIEFYPSQDVKVSIPQTFLYPSYIAQRIYYSIFGRYSLRLLGLCNQAFIWFGAALLGFLIFKLAVNSKFQPVQSLMLGLSSGIVYQTFPWNLVQFFRLYPMAIAAIFLITFLIIIHREQQVAQLERTHIWLRSIVIFLFAWFDHIGSFFFLASYLFITWQFRPEILMRTRPALLLLAWVFGYVLFKGQVLYIAIRYPELNFTGSGFLYRSGLDGSISYYRDLFALFDRTSYRPFYMDKLGKSSHLSDWKFLFSVSCIVFASIVCVYGVYGKYRNVAAMISVPVVAYLLFAFTLTQAAITHPFVYDVYLLIPCILAIYYALPQLLVQNDRTRPIVVTVLVLFSYAYSMIQLREYVIAFPIDYDKLWITFGS